MDVIKTSCEEQLLSDFRGQVYYGVSELLEDKMNVLGPASLAFSKSESLVS